MTIQGTAAQLGVARKTVRAACRRLGIVPFAPAGERGPKLLSFADRGKIRAALKRPA